MPGPLTAEQVARTFEGTDEAIDFKFPEGAPDGQPPVDTTPPADGNNQPANTPPPTTEPAAATPPAANAFNFDEELGKISGGAIKTKDELATLLETSRKAQDLENQLRTYQEENTNLKGKAEANPFANDFTKKLNDLYASNANENQIQAFMAINKVDVDTLSPMQASALALQVKHGLTPDEANAYLAKKYEIDLNDKDFVMDKNAEIALKIDSSADRDFLKTHKAEVSAVPEDNTAKMQQLQEQQNQQRIQAVLPIAQAVTNETLSSIFKEVSINGKTGVDAIKIELPISEENKPALLEAVNNYVQNFNVPATEEGRKQIAAFVENSAVIQNWKNWAIDIASKTELRVRAEYDNPSSINRGNAAPPGGKTKEQVRTDAVMKTLQDAGEIDY